MVITREWVDSCRCPTSGGFTGAQFDILQNTALKDLVFDGKAPMSGWVSRILGKELDLETAQKFFDAKTVLRKGKKISMPEIEFGIPDLHEEVTLRFNLMEGEVIHHALSTLLGYDKHCLTTTRYETELEKRLWEAEIRDLKSLISRLEAVLPKP